MYADIKTQNISLGLTDNTKTTFDNGDVIFGINPMEVLDEFSIKAEDSFNNITAPETGGFRFTIRNPIIIKYVCFKVSHWGSADLTKQWNLYNQDSEQLITGLTLDKLKEYKGYYYTQPTNPIYIEAGSYACALILNNGDKKHNFGSANAFFNDIFVGPNGAFSSPDPAPTLAYPNGGSNTPSSAIVFDVINKVIAEGGVEARYGLTCNEANLGIVYNNYFLDGLGDGAGNLYGSPGLTTNAVYTSSLALGGVAGTAGKATYEIFDLTKAGTIINIYKNFRMAPWDTDGGFINADFGVWRVEYQNFPVAGTSKWNIYANGGIIHTNTTNLIVPSSTYGEEDITISFDVDNQIFTIKHFNQTLFTFTDTTPRTITQAQRNLYSVSGGAVAGFSNTTTIYDQKVFNPGSTNSIVQITPTNFTASSDNNIVLNDINITKFGDLTSPAGAYTQFNVVKTAFIDPELNQTQDLTISGHTNVKIQPLSQIQMNKTLVCQGANQYDSQIKFKDTTTTREQAAVGFISGDGSNGLKWILGGAGDLNKVIFKTYAANDDLQFDTQDTNTMTLSSTGNLSLARGNLNVLNGNIVSTSGDANLLNGNINVSSGDVNVPAGLVDSANIQTRQILGNCGLGFNIFPSLTNGAENVVIGTNSGSNLNGQENTVLGCYAGNAITTGLANVLIGHSAGYGVVGNYNTCIGQGSNSTGNSSIVIGRQVNNAASNVIVIGENTKTALYNDGNGVCDLGTSTKQFKDIYITGDLKKNGYAPRTVYKGSAGSTATVYEDDKVKFIWNASTKQPQYQVKVAPTGSWVDGGIQLTHEPLSQEFITEVDDLTVALNTTFYFTTSGSRNSSFDMSNYGNMATTWLIAETDATYPAYFCRWITGNTTASLCCIIERN
jgi:hypothetical protein